MKNISIRVVRIGDEHLLREYYLRNWHHFKPWSPERTLGTDTPEHWRAKMNAMLSEQDSGKAVFLLALDSDNTTILAHCSLTQICHGVFKACYLGFGVDEAQQGSGIMKHLCLNAIDVAFNDIGLHRVMANYMPHNNRSAYLLLSLIHISEPTRPY